MPFILIIADKLSYILLILHGRGDLKAVELREELHFVVLERAADVDLEDVLETGANDVYVISSAEDPKKEILLPVIRDVILEINPEEGYMKVHMLPGLE